MYFAPHCTMSWQWRVRRFAAVNAWERPLWITGTSSNWVTAVAAEAQAAEESVLLVDRSADAKYLLTGPQVDEWLAGNVTTLLPAVKAAAVLAPLLGQRGQIEALTRTRVGQMTQ